MAKKNPKKTAGDVSKYLEFLPLIYQTESAEGSPFPGRFLKAFEKILSGRDDEAAFTGIGIEEILDRIHEYFDPDKTPPEFVEWLAGWAALELKKGKGWEDDESGRASGGDSPLQRLPCSEKPLGRNRHLIRSLIPIYHQRATKQGIEQALAIYLGEDAEVITVNELLEPFQVGVKPSAVVGLGTVVGEAHPYYFRVDVKLPAPVKLTVGRKKKQSVAGVIDAEKPAHTFYTLTVKAPPMQVGVYCTVGEDTLLGGFIM